LNLFFPPEHLAERYASLLAQIDEQAQRVGRDPKSIQLIAVTKEATVEQMQHAYQLGMRHFGESRLQGALAKMAQLPKDVVWHFIGRIQSNKLRKILKHFDYVHSVDSFETLQQIADQSEGQHPRLFLQMNIFQEGSKQGFTEEDLRQNFTSVLNLKVVGLMTMAPLHAPAEAIREGFKRLRLLRDGLSEQAFLPELSMGMSQDFLIAIEEGATFIRIGSALFKK
jgi:pyridoxal phosphate enzyme (YggS family)